MQPHEVRQVLDAATQAWAAGQRTALATVVGVAGSAYRREGTKMLVREDGMIACMISGGCLEPEVAEVAKRVLERGQPERVSYDLEEEVVWGLGLGCGGAVEVYIEPLEEGSLLASWLERQERGERAVLATALTGGEGRLLLPADGEPQGKLMPASLAEELARVAAGLLEGQTPRAASHSFGATRVFLDVSSPPLELVLFGGGHDARPLAKMALELGLEVTVVDPRPAFANVEHFPRARIILSHPRHFPERVPLGPRSHVVVMNHHLERDRASLDFVLGSEAPYVGVLGPRSRYIKLLDALRAEGREPRPQALARVRSPIGLNIGAEGPDEVALSITAEILAFSRGFGGGFLHGWEGRIHDPVRS